MGIAERRYQRYSAGEGINRNPFAIRPEQQQAPPGVQREIQPRGDNRERIAYVDHRGLLQSITVDETSEELTVVSRRKARGTKQQKMAVRSDVNGRERNLAGTKKTHGFPGAYGLNVDSQHEGEATQKCEQHVRDGFLKDIKEVLGRDPRGSTEEANFRRAIIRGGKDHAREIVAKLKAKGTFKY